MQDLIQVAEYVRIERRAMEALPAILWLLPWLASAVMANMSQPSFQATFSRGLILGLLAMLFTFICKARGLEFAPSAVFSSIFATLIAIYWPKADSTETIELTRKRERGFHPKYEFSSTETSQAQSLADQLKQSRPPAWLRPTEILNKNAASNHPGLARSGGSEGSPKPSRPIIEFTNKTASNRHPSAVGPRHPASKTQARDQTTNSGLFDPEDWREESFLKRMGYRAGASGLPPSDRREVLRCAFELPLPAGMPLDYARECGQPKSTVRLQRIAQHLRGRISMAERRQANMAHAIHDWRSDLRWLATQYGQRFPEVRFA